MARWLKKILTAAAHPFFMSYGRVYSTQTVDARSPLALQIVENMKKHMIDGDVFVWILSKGYPRVFDCEQCNRLLTVTLQKIVLDSGVLRNPSVFYHDYNGVVSPASQGLDKIFKILSNPPVPDCKVPACQSKQGGAHSGRFVSRVVMFSTDSMVEFSIYSP